LLLVLEPGARIAGGRHRGVMKALIVGNRGMLGTELMRVFSAAGEVTGVDIAELDITDAGQCLDCANRVRPEVIINAAALTAVDYCESHEEEANRVNGDGPGNMAAAAAESGSLLVHYSTDYVFDGRKEAPYAETDPTCPRSAYGRSKLLGEQKVQARSPEHLILRTAWLFGCNGKNFIRTILKAARSGQPLRVVDDQRGSPTNARDLAAHTLRLVQSGEHGIFHAANTGSCSWYELAARSIEWAGMEGVKISPCSTSEYPLPAPRPANSVLAPTRLVSCGVGPMRPWQEAVQDYIRECGNV
jgi:dTDP-4-dehydrorhamnose reductase